MKNLTSDEKKKPLEIIEITSEKIVLKTTYPWTFCLNASHEEKVQYYSLNNNYLNCQKLQKLAPDYDFFKTLSSEILVNNFPQQLRDYQLEDVNFQFCRA